METMKPPDLPAILKRHTPGTGSIQELRDDFSSFYLSLQRDRNPRLIPVRIRDRFTAYWISGPESLPDRTILFFHGGGFSLGSTGDHLGLCSRLAEVTEARVFSVDYRLAPEYPFPAAVEDCIAAYEYLIVKGFDPDRIVLAGISAGGTLVLTTLLEARERGLPLPAAAVCISPAVDMNFCGESVTANQEADWVTPARLDAIRTSYLRDNDPSNPLASPIRADLSGLPPLMIQAGSSEVLIDGIRAFVEKAQNAGVNVQFDLADGMFHCWQVFADVLPEGAEAVGRIGEFIRKQMPDHLHG